METTEFIISEFTLTYDGIYWINVEEKYLFEVHLTFGQVYQLFEKEGLDFKKHNAVDWYHGIKFTKSKIVMLQFEGGDLNSIEIGCSIHHEGTVIFLSFVEVLRIE